MAMAPNIHIICNFNGFYAPNCARAVRWDCCGINWHLSGDPILSDKDAIAPTLADFDSPFIYWENS